DTVCRLLPRCRLWPVRAARRRRLQRLRRARRRVRALSCQLPVQQDQLTDRPFACACTPPHVAGRDWWERCPFNRVTTRLAASRPILPASEPRIMSRSINEACVRLTSSKALALSCNELRAGTADHHRDARACAVQPSALEC